MNGVKRIRVAGFDYAINEDADIEATVNQIRDALTKGDVVEVPVLDEKGNSLKLLVHGGQVGAVVVDLDEGPPRPGEIPPLRPTVG